METHTIKTTLEQIGENPFDAQSLEVIAQNEVSKLERVSDPLGKGRNLLRKTKRVKVSDDKTLDVPKLTKREIKFLIDNDEPNFPNAYGYFHGVVDGEWVVSTLREYVPGESLEDAVKNSGALSPEIATDYVKQILDSLHILHEREFLFRDLKPSNVIKVNDSVSQQYPLGQVKITDFDSLGRTEVVQGLGGSTFGVGSTGWTHPDTVIPNLASTRTDIFAAGTTLYFLLMGRQGNLARDRAGGVGIEKTDMQLLEEKFGQTEGGPELVRFVEKLVAPQEENQFGNAAEALAYVGQLQTIFEEGYRGLKDKSFRIHRENIGKILARDVVRGFGNLGKGTKNVASDLLGFMGGVLQHPVGLGLTVGLVAGAPAYLFTAEYLTEKSANRPVFFTPSIDGDASIYVRVAAEIANTANLVGATYVKLNSENAPNDVIVLKEAKEAIARINEGLMCIEEGKKAIDVFRDPIGKISESGVQIEQSYSHRKRDNYHTEVYTVPVTHTDANGNTTTTIETRTRQVYDNTDHYWTFTREQAHSGTRKLRQGIEEMDTVGLVPITLAPFLSKTSPAQDVLGRPVEDLQAYRSGQNEWIKEGIVPFFNNLTNVTIVSMDSNVVFYLDASQQGFSNRNAFPEEKHVRNTCSSCDEREAPEGYLAAQAVGVKTGMYTHNFSRIDATLRSAPEKYQELRMELETVVQKLEKGKRVSARDIGPAADVATELYETMVSDSKITAPTARAQVVYPILTGLVMFSLAGIGAFALRMKGRDYYSY